MRDQYASITCESANLRQRLFDFSVYVDADPVLIEKWYLDRFGALLDTAFQNPENYYYRFAIGDREEAFKMAKDVWKNVNLKIYRNISCLHEEEPI